MKLTIVKIDEKGTTSDTIEYDGEPQHQAGFYPASEPNTGMVCGCRALWCYYRRGKRVATIQLKTYEREESFLRGRPTGLNSVAIIEGWNRRLKPFRIFWPESVEIVYGDSGFARYQRSMQLWLTDGKTQMQEPEQCDCTFSGCYLHPADDDAFHETMDISAAERNWISERDREAERDHQQSVKPTMNVTLKRKRKENSAKRKFVFKSNFCELWEGSRRLARIRAGMTANVTRELLDNVRHENHWTKWTDLQARHGFTRDNPREFFADSALGRVLWKLCERKVDTSSSQKDWLVRLNPKYDFGTK